MIATFNPKLNKYTAELPGKFDEILPERKEALLQFAQYISNKLKENQTAKLVFICTHNSRRSHLGQVWAFAAAEYFGIKNVETYSGGTEATSFNPRAVEVIKRAGFMVDTDNPCSENPDYSIRLNKDQEPYKAFSKIFSDPHNPQNGFCAVMVCSDADEGCPYIPGAEKRIPLSYEDPKHHDNTDMEALKYDERCEEIGRDMFFVMSEVKK